MTKSDFLVVGGGILGSATAARLVLRGANVILIDDASDELPASVRTLGWVNATAPVPTSYHTLRILGKLRLLEENTRGKRQFYEATGTLDWAARNSRQPLPGVATQETIAESAVRLAGLGHDAFLITAEQASRIDPALDASEIDGPVLFSRDDGYVDLPVLIELLQKRITVRGGTIRHARAAGLLRDGDRVIGARTIAGEELHAETVIVATGKGTTELLATANVNIPTNSSVGVTIITKPVEVPPRTLLRAPLVGAHANANGGIRIVTGLAEAAVRPDSSVPQETIDEVLAHLSRWLVGHPTLVAENVLVGARPIPGDGFPVVGPVTTRPGLAVSFAHSGATVGLLLGDLLADELVGDAPSELLADFRPARFSEEEHL